MVECEKQNQLNVENKHMNCDFWVLISSGSNKDELVMKFNIVHVNIKFTSLMV